ncbi:MAG: helix-turn-helix transcriptional regulator [Muribaculaceae bacterium]|nr:helix-turn-helix transcriptional regulator [Muribaculaceae bacterium]
MKATLTNIKTGEKIPVTARTVRPGRQPVWVDDAGVAYFEVGCSGAPLYTVEAEPTIDEVRRQVRKATWDNPQARRQLARRIGERLRDEREKRRITHEQLEQLTGISATRIAKYEDGTYSGHFFDHAAAINATMAAAIGCKLDITPAG